MKNRKNKKEKNIYGIIGLGRFGSALVNELAQDGAELIILDRDAEKISAVRELTENAFVVRNLEKKTLEQTGIQECDVVVVCIGEHMDTSILTTLNLVNMGIPKVIAKAKSVEHGEILEKLGAEVVYPERDMAIRLAHRLEASRIVDFIQLSEQINISKMMCPKKAIGKSVIELNLRAKFGLNIIAIKNSGVVNEHIMPSYVFREEDILFLCGKKEGLARLQEWANV